MRKDILILIVLLTAGAVSLWSCSGRKADSPPERSFRRPAQNGWTLVHLEGSPFEIGYQHGLLLAAEILDMKNVAALELAHDYGRDWEFFRTAARDMMWPRIELRYRQELQGISDGARAKDVDLDLWDIIALNALLEWPYYLDTLEEKSGAAEARSVPERCSAFVAVGSYTKDGRVVMAHNIWTTYLEGQRWTIVFDIAPAEGHRIVCDGLPGFIASGSDFGLNSAGLMITETTIGEFKGFDPAGIPEFVRARKAMQFAGSIDEFVRLMKDGNNGGYANNWLVADRKTNEIASLELGLKNVTLERTQDGCFVGANFPVNPQLVREETKFDPADLSLSANARRLRWDALMADHKGRIDLDLAKRFMADHYDSFQGQDDPGERTLCGHIELSPRGFAHWLPPYAAGGAAQNKVVDSAAAERMSFWALAGHACGLDFKATEHLKAHPEFSWQKDLLRDMPSRPWTLVGIEK